MKPRRELHCAWKQLTQARHNLKAGTPHHSAAYWRWRRRVARRWISQARYRLDWPEPGWWLVQAACIRSHEGAWTSATGNGYEGAYQFLRSTWESVGGHTAPSGHWASVASPSEQTYRAWLVWRRDGGSWHEWGTAGACHLQ